MTRSIKSIRCAPLVVVAVAIALAAAWPGAASAQSTVPGTEDRAPEARPGPDAPGEPAPDPPEALEGPAQEPEDEITLDGDAADGEEADAPDPPGTPKIARKIPNSKLERARLLSDLYATLATAEDAAAAKKVADRIETIWLRSGSDTVGVLMQRAAQATSQKDHALALELLNAVVDLAPDFAEGWNRRAYVQFLEADYRAALGDLRRALALDPSHFKALDGVATILRETGDDPAALKAYERLIEVHPYWDGAERAYEELRGKVRGRGI